MHPFRYGSMINIMVMYTIGRLTKLAMFAYSQHHFNEPDLNTNAYIVQLFLCVFPIQLKLSQTKLYSLFKSKLTKFQLR